MTREPIVVVGAGIAGLAAALALSRVGFPVEIFERANEIRPVGAGIQLSPNALRVLARLGLLDEVKARSVAAETVTLRTARSGKVLASVPVSSADGTGYLAIHRADLQDVLLRAVQAAPLVRLQLGTRLLRAVNEGARCALAFRSEETTDTFERQAFLAVAADGAGSAVAKSLALPPARDSGLVAARFMAGAAMVEEPPSGIEAWLGARRHAVAYPVRGGADVNLVLLGPPISTAAEAISGVRGWDGRLNALLERSDFRGVWPLATSERGLVHGRLCLIGDAGHAMLPFAAQGSAMALEDAFVLAQELARTVDGEDPSAALARFEAARLPRLAAVRARVRFHRFTYHLPPPFAFGRDLALRLRAPERLRADLGWLYDWAP